jgi:hypothetical protein
MRDKIYLTPELIKEVLHQAGEIEWKMGVLAKFTKHWYDVLTVSPLGLIHIHGNQDTGWKHIMDRHGYFSNKSYFGDGAVGNPNKFTSSSIPIHDYRDIADEIFLQQQKDSRPHPDDQLFEKYKGTSTNYTGSTGKVQEFQLVLYKNTKIVHSLYPSKNLEGKSPKRVLKEFIRVKDKITASTRPCDDYFIIHIPYKNTRGFIRYVIIFKVDKETQATIGYLQVNDQYGVPAFTIYQPLCNPVIKTVLPTNMIEVPLEFTRFLNGLSIADLSKLEKVILDVETDMLKLEAKENTNK